MIFAISAMYFFAVVIPAAVGLICWYAIRPTEQMKLMDELAEGGAIASQYTLADVLPELRSTISPDREARLKQMVDQARKYMDAPSRETVEKQAENWRKIPDDEWDQLCKNL